MAEGKIPSKRPRIERPEVKDDNISDPFTYVLQCRRSCTTTKDGIRVLWWLSERPPVRLEDERDLVDHMLLPYGKEERGMFRKQPRRRIRELRDYIQSKKTSMDVLAALSLRRHHMKYLNPELTMTQLGLGRQDDIRRSAAIFEKCVADYLDAHRIQYYSEMEQSDHNKKHRPEGQPSPPTPDFILREPLCIKVYRKTKKNKQTHKILIKERTIHWLEVKMYYGAGSIPFDNQSAVGTLLNTAKKYQNVYGDGAMIFMNGFGNKLCQELSSHGVLLLDARGVIDVEPVKEHQRTWCAHWNGSILP